jgi:hypothetical protein
MFTMVESENGRLLEVKQRTLVEIEPVDGYIY